MGQWRDENGLTMEGPSANIVGEMSWGTYVVAACWAPGYGA